MFRVEIYNSLFSFYIPVCYDLSSDDRELEVVWVALNQLSLQVKNSLVLLFYQIQNTPSNMITKLPVQKKPRTAIICLNSSNDKKNKNKPDVRQSIPGQSRRQPIKSMRMNRPRRVPKHEIDVSIKETNIIEPNDTKSKNDCCL